MLYRQLRKYPCGLCGRREWRKKVTATVINDKVMLLCLACAAKVHLLLDPGALPPKAGQ